MTRVRATETLLTVGYPMISYSLLRDVKDWAIFTAAIASGLTTRRNIEGFGAIDPWVSVLTDAHYATIHRSRMSEQDRVLKKMLREASDLDAGVVNELVIWERMFNSEVHGARLSFARHGLAWLRGEAPLPIGPSFDEGLCAMYLNRAGEVGWMMLRTYPLLQLGPSAFGAEWATKWQVLDESFRYYVKSLGKPIVNVIEKFVDKRFPFSPGEDSYERCPE